MKSKLRNQLIIVFMVLPAILFAQKPIKNSMGEYKYTLLPFEPLPKNYTAYYVKSDSYDSYIEDKINNSLNIAGYDKTDNESGDFHVYVKEYEFIITEPKKQTEKKTKKVDGKDVAYNLYNYAFNVTHKMKIKVYDKNNSVILGHTLSEDAKTFFSPKSHDSKVAYNKYKEYVKQTKSKLFKDKLSKLNVYINNRIGYPRKSEYIYIYTIKVKKYIYDDYTEAFELAKEAIEALKENENAIDENLDNIHKAIGIWQKALEEYDPDNKKTRIDKKVATVTNYNIAQVYFVIKDYEKCAEYLNNVDEIDRTFKNTMVLLEKVKDLKKRNDANN